LPHHIKDISQELNMLKDLVQRNRSYRRFDQSARIQPSTLRELVDLTRLSPSGGNKQPMKYMLITSEEVCAKVFPQLRWATYLKDWDGPKEGERPAAYVIVLGDTTIASNFGVDPGIAMQTLLLGAVERGLGGCMLANIIREELKAALEIPSQFEILYVVALGKPVEKVVIDPVGEDGDIKYWRDAQQTHHLPKRALSDLIVAEK
jgi:nitroreductase